MGQYKKPNPIKHPGWPWADYPKNIRLKIFGFILLGFMD
jgi:hypothetical protein